jgi:hypothetical protein
LISIRKLAAVDMAWLGTRIILVEYALGIILPLILGVISIRSGFSSSVFSTWEAASGLWLVSIATNYVPLFIYAVLLAKGGTVKAEGEPELAHARRYGVQQIIILVPFLVVILALAQEARGRKETKEAG